MRAIPASPALPGIRFRAWYALSLHRISDATSARCSPTRTATHRRAPVAAAVVACLSGVRARLSISSYSPGTGPPRFRVRRRSSLFLGGLRCYVPPGACTAAGALYAQLPGLQAMFKRLYRRSLATMHRGAECRTSSDGRALHAARREDCSIAGSDHRFDRSCVDAATVGLHSTGGCDYLAAMGQDTGLMRTPPLGTLVSISPRQRAVGRSESLTAAGSQRELSFVCFRHDA